MHTHRASAFVFALTLVACKLPSPEPEPHTSSAALTSACGNAFDAYIARGDRCGFEDVDLLAHKLGYDPAARGRFQEYCALLDERPGNGKTTAFWNGCAKTLAEADCGDVQSLQNACSRAHGTIADGEPCATDDVCANGYCHKPTSADCGTCGGLSQVGEPCGGSTGTCADGLVCAQDNTCIRPHSREAYARCSSDQECRIGYHCAWDTYYDYNTCTKGAASSTTSTLPGEGERCDYSCRTGLRCTDKRCVKAERLEPGAVCAPSWECASGFVCRLNPGSSAGYCVKAAGEGESCRDRPCGRLLKCGEGERCRLDDVLVCKKG